MLAAKEGLLFMWDMGIHSIHLEGNSQNDSNSIANKEEDLSYNGSIVRDICLYASWSTCFECNYVSRSGNIFLYLMNYTYFSYLKVSF